MVIPQDVLVRLSAASAKIFQGAAAPVGTVPHCPIRCIVLFVLSASNTSSDFAWAGYSALVRQHHIDLSPHNGPNPWSRSPYPSPYFHLASSRAWGCPSGDPNSSYTPAYVRGSPPVLGIRSYLPPILLPPLLPLGRNPVLQSNMPASLRTRPQMVRWHSY
jgi:hypothetical protein